MQDAKFSFHGLSFNVMRECWGYYGWPRGTINRDNAGWEEQGKWCMEGWNGVNHFLQGPASMLLGDWTDQQSERETETEEESERKIYQCVGMWSSYCMVPKW